MISSLKDKNYIQVMNDITIARLAYILMILFEMQGSHLYLFEVLIIVLKWRRKNWNYKINN